MNFMKNTRERFRPSAMIQSGVELPDLKTGHHAAGKVILSDVAGKVGKRLHRQRSNLGDRPIPEISRNATRIKTLRASTRTVAVRGVVDSW
jgi:hypothetical protein